MKPIPGSKCKVGKTYKIQHTRKGEWTAKCIANDGTWVTVDDDPSSPIRGSLFQATEVKVAS